MTRGTGREWGTRTASLLTAAVIAVGATAPVGSAAGSYPIKPRHPVPRAVTKAVRKAAARAVGGDAAVSCTYARRNHYRCHWLIGPPGAINYRLQTGGTATAIVERHNKVKVHLVVTCSPDGLHDVCED